MTKLSQDEMDVDVELRETQVTDDPAEDGEGSGPTDDPDSDDGPSSMIVAFFVAVARTYLTGTIKLLPFTLGLAL